MSQHNHISSINASATNSPLFQHHHSYHSQPVQRDPISNGNINQLHHQHVIVRHNNRNGSRNLSPSNKHNRGASRNTNSSFHSKLQQNPTPFSASVSNHAPNMHHNHHNSHNQLMSPHPNQNTSALAAGHHNHNHNHNHHNHSQSQHVHQLAGHAGTGPQSGFVGRHGALTQDGDFPLRILVQSDMVGAIIGRSGSTIKSITQQSKARIDVHREESQDQQEKVITITGSPESCSAACFKIVEVILNEKQSQLAHKNINSNDTNDDPLVNSSDGLDPSIGVNNKHNDTTDPPHHDVQLKILAHNNLIGRLIGRNGASIKKIMEQTNTKINVTVSNLTDCTNERTITVMGDLDQVRQAEQVISSKLRTAYMSDMSANLQAMSNQPPYLFNNVPIPYLPGPYTQNPILSTLVNSQASHGGHNMPRAMPIGSHQGQMTGPSPLYPNSPNYLSLYSNITVPPTGLLGYNPAVSSGLEVKKETVNIYIPNVMVGALIGKSGFAIKEMIVSSGASIRVAAASSQPAESPSLTATSKDNFTKKDQSEQQDAKKHQDVNDEIATELNEETIDSQKASATIADTNPQSGPTTQRQNSYESLPSNRKVTIIGTPESQWSAQYLIYRKVSIENKKSDISLMVEIQVPSHSVGRIIGKGGVTVKQIQKQTRSTIRLPDEKPSETIPEGDSMTCVQITGEFHNSQLAQRQIRNLIKERPQSNSRQNNNISNNNTNNVHSKPTQNRRYESNSGKSNAQTNFNDNHQHRSDNESTSTPDEGEVPEVEAQEENGIEVETSKESEVDQQQHQKGNVDEEE